MLPVAKPDKEEDTEGLGVPVRLCVVVAWPDCAAETEGAEADAETEAPAETLGAEAEGVSVDGADPEREPVDVTEGEGEMRGVPVPGGTAVPVPKTGEAVCAALTERCALGESRDAVVSNEALGVLHAEVEGLT